MSNNKRPPPGPGQRGRKRPAPTIDLTATEVAEGPAAASAAATADPAPEPASAGPEPQAANIDLDTTARPQEPQAGMNAKTDPDAASPPRTSIAWLPPDIPWPLVGAGVAGAVLALIVVFAASMLLPRESPVTVEARLMQAEQQIRELTARPASAGIDRRTFDELSGRVAQLETSVAAPRPQVSDPALINRIASIEGEVKSLSERIGVLGRRSDETATAARDARQRADAAAALAESNQNAARSASPADRSEIDALSTRIAALERSVKALEAELAKRGAGEGADRSARLAVAAEALKDAVERGDPYAAELGAAKSAAPDPKLLTPLEPFAASGAPTTAALARELTDLVPALTRAVGAARDGGILDRLQANAEKLVRVRPVDETAGDDAGAVISRIQARAGQSDLAGALSELAKLSASARAPAQSWIAKAQARNVAVDAGRRFAADAVAALAK